MDFSPYEEELTTLLNEGGVQDRDRLDRLSAAHNLTLALRDGKSSELAVQAYLEAILEIEQRAQEEVIEEGGVPHWDHRRGWWKRRGDH